MTPAKKTISILVPVYNEEPNIPSLYAALQTMMSDLRDRYDFEILFTDNCSEDGTFAAIQALGAADPCVRAIRFNRNYGFQRSLLTAYRNCRGDAAVQIDADLQDPPELIPRFMELWEAGADVVYGVRVERDEPRLLHWCRGVFYRLLNYISDDRLPADAGDFRLTDRSIIDKLNAINDHSPYVRGIISSFALRDAGIPYTRRKRAQGRSKFPLPSLIRFALEAVIAHSVMPLRIATYVGLFVTCGTLLLLAYYGLRMLVFGAVWPGGLTTVVALILANLGLSGIFFGVIGEYVGRIYLQSRWRPLTVVSDVVNIDARPRPVESDGVTRDGSWHE